MSKDEYINLPVRIKTPSVPNFVEVIGIKHSSLDEAIAAGGKGLSIDVADLDKETIERLGRQWTDRLLANAETRRNLPQQSLPGGEQGHG